MKKVILAAILLGGSVPVYCQSVRGETKTETTAVGDNITSLNNLNSSYRPYYIGWLPLPFMFVNRVGLQSDILYSGQVANGYTPATTPGGFRNTRFSAPLKFHYQIFPGVSIQAGSQLGSLTGTRQAKLGASVHLPMGVNFTAGYGAGLNTMNKIGYGNRNQGLQITAGYRLWK
jgi:hypothetical protein